LGVKAAGDVGTTAPTAEPTGGLLDRLKKGLGKTSTRLSDGIAGLFTKRKLCGDTLDDLEDVLIEADLGLDTAERIVTALGKGRYEKGIGADDVRTVLKAEVERVLAPVARPLEMTRGKAQSSGCRLTAPAHDDDRQAGPLRREEGW
jgi:fused signal recognition particle receptor